MNIPQQFINKLYKELPSRQKSKKNLALRLESRAIARAMIKELKSN